MIPLLTVFGSTVFIYFMLVLCFRLIGRGELGQLTLIDLVIILIMGSAVETSMVNGNTSLSAGLVSAATLILCNFISNKIASRSRRSNHLLCGGIRVLVHNGHPVGENLHRLGMTMDDLMSAVRQRGYDSLDKIKYAVFEEDGQITVIDNSSKTVNVPAESNPAKSHRLAKPMKKRDGPDGAA